MVALPVAAIYNLLRTGGEILCYDKHSKLRQGLSGAGRKEARRLSGMDQRLMALIRLRQEPIEMRPFSLGKMCREALSIFPEVSLQGEDVSLCGKRELMMELLRNLVVNALRFGGEAPVEMRLAPDGFTVRDHGCGMTPQQASQAFEPFFKADPARSRAAGGAGLGLTLCREIARAHGETLTLGSHLGEGTCVRYRMGENVSGC